MNSLRYLSVIVITSLAACVGENPAGDVSPDAMFEVRQVAERGGEGCTPGYWKQEQHFGDWPVDPFSYTFGEAFGGFCDSMSRNLRACDITLLEALGLRGRGQDALARQAAAAWLNSGSTVEFKYLPDEVETMVETALLSGRIRVTKDALAEANEAGCPLARSDQLT